MTVEVPREQCDLVPQKMCSQVPKFIPSLQPVKVCNMVPKEICHKERTKPKSVKKFIPKQWCGKSKNNCMLLIVKFSQNSNNLTSCIVPQTIVRQTLVLERMQIIQAKLIWIMLRIVPLPAKSKYKRYLHNVWTAFNKTLLTGMLPVSFSSGLVTVVSLVLSLQRTNAAWAHLPLRRHSLTSKCP